MEIFNVYTEEIPRLLKDGNVLLHPTDTVWGLAAISSSREAVDRIYSLKNRERNKPLILLVDNINRLKSYVKEIHPRIETLLNYHRRPLTIIYNNTRNVPDYLKAEDGSIGIRIVQDHYCQKLIADIGEPIVSTSANLSHEPTPHKYADISDVISDGVDLIFRPNTEEHNREPSVIAMLDENEELIFLRN